jgi:hypothetical protein
MKWPLITDGSIGPHGGIAPPSFPRNNIARYKAALYLLNNLQITMIVWQKMSAARQVRVNCGARTPLPAGPPSGSPCLREGVASAARI